MRVINQSIEVMDHLDSKAILSKLEQCGRICYKSEDRITDDSAKRFVNGIIKSKHESVLEHVSITVKAITSRSVSHQLVRHRIASYSQESQRYVNYSKDKHDSEIVFIEPKELAKNETAYNIWKSQCSLAGSNYLCLIELGIKPEDAREVLPNSTKTEIIITMNLRSWRHFLKIRTAKDADPKIRELAYLILEEFKEKIKVIFDDIDG